MRGGNRIPRKFYANLRLERIPQEQLYKEAAFIAYYFHWSPEEILSMPHRERRRWCGEISGIHKETNAESPRGGVSIEDIKF